MPGFDICSLWRVPPVASVSPIFAILRLQLVLKNLNHMTELQEYLLDYQGQEYPWAKGPSNKIWMILGPSKKKWMILWDDLWAKQQTEYG